jgi:hypothetical protein
MEDGRSGERGRAPASALLLRPCSSEPSQPTRAGRGSRRTDQRSPTDRPLHALRAALSETPVLAWGNGTSKRPARTPSGKARVRNDADRSAAAERLRQYRQPSSGVARSDQCRCLAGAGPAARIRQRCTSSRGRRCSAVTGRICRPCIAAVARVVGVLAGAPIRGGLQAHVAVAPPG